MTTRHWPEAIRGDVKVDLEYIGEGHDNDYVPDDPDDEPLLRMTVYVKDGLRARFSDNGDLADETTENVWADIRNGCWCTQLADTMTDAEKQKAAEMILDIVYEPVVAGAYKRAVGEVTWLHADDVRKALKGDN